MCEAFLSLAVANTFEKSCGISYKIAFLACWADALSTASQPVPDHRFIW
jgi:hypothetical protein